MKKNESLFTIELMNCNAFLSHLILHAFENSIRRRSHLGKAESRKKRRKTSSFCHFIFDAKSFAINQDFAYSKKSLFDALVGSKINFLNRISC